MTTRAPEISVTDATTQQPRGTAIVVGASLAGLMSAIALTYQGFDVTVLERTSHPGVAGASLRVSPHGPRTVVRGDGTGRRAASLRRITSAGSDRSVEAWSVIRARLLAAVRDEPRVTVREGATVARVGQGGDEAWVELTTGERLAADVVVGADGHRSVVRRAVHPERPDARFAGYLIWVGRVEESSLPESQWLPDGDRIVMDFGSRAVLFAGALPGHEGSSRRGLRTLTWALYDASRNALLRDLGAVRGSVVRHSVRGADIPRDVLTQLADEVAVWPPEWRDVVRVCLTRRLVTGTPIAEYVPDRMVAGRLALVGDAAHVPTPMTGSGFDAALEDAEALGAALGAAEDPAGIPGALEVYQDERLAEVRDLVRGGQSFSRVFGAA